VAEEAASSQKTGIMKNKQTSLFHQQNRANQRLMTTARKTRKETVMQDSLTSIQTRIDSEKITRQQSLLRQREYEESLKSLTDNGAANSRMSIARFEETSQLRKKIDNEKDLRRRSAITRNSLADELSEISASASGKPTAGVAKKLVVVIPEEVEASSSGRVSVAFAQVEFAQRRAQVGSSEEVESYSDGTFSFGTYSPPIDRIISQRKSLRKMMTLMPQLASLTQIHHTLIVPSPHTKIPKAPQMVAFSPKPPALWSLTRITSKRGHHRTRHWRVFRSHWALVETIQIPTVSPAL
jgi:hypothetical protein